MKKLILPITFLFFSLPFASQEVKFSGEAGTFWAAALRTENRGDFIVGDTYLNGKVEAFYEKSSAYAEGRAGFDEVENKNYAKLKEIWLDYTSDFWGVRIGRQKTAWGKADGIDIVNVICPKDYSSVRSMVESEYSAIDSARFSLNKDNILLDAYFIPFFTPAALPEDKTAKFSSITLPEKNLKSAEYGLKLSGYFSKCDISLYGFYGRDDMPFLDYVPKIKNGTQSGIEANANYKNMAMLGADAAIPIGQLVLRLEGAFFPERHFQKSSSFIIEEKNLSAEKLSSASIESSLQRNEVSALAGLDWMPESWTFTAQYYCDYVFGELENLEREKALQHGATLSVSKKLLSDTLELSFSGVLGLNDFDSFIKPAVTYSLSDQINLSGGAYIFIPGPDKDGQYGSYKDLSMGYIKCKFSF